MRLSKQQSSRRGADGARGERGSTGSAGRDAVVKIVQADGKVLIVDMQNRIQAELIPVKGERGSDGRNAPSLAEIVQAFIEHFKRALA